MDVSSAPLAASPTDRLRGWLATSALSDRVFAVVPAGSKKLRGGAGAAVSSRPLPVLWTALTVDTSAEATPSSWVM